jgi:hypothetical protein
MRPCVICVSSGVACVVSPLDPRCEQYYRLYRFCELAPLWKEAEKVQKELDKVYAKFMEAEAKALRLRR